MSLENKEYIEFESDKISIKYTNNNSDKTIFAIHGINSDKDFIGHLDTYQKKYNVFSFSYGDVKNLKISNFVKVTNFIFDKYFSDKKIIIVSHSLGGYIATKLFDRKNIIKYIFINPFHPLTFEYKPFLKTIDSALKKPELFHIKQMSTQTKHMFADMINKRLRWYKVLIEIGKKLNFFKNELEKITNQKNKSVFIRSSGDFIISGRLLDKYLKNKEITCKVIKYTGHSPLIKESGKVYELFDL